MQGPCGRREHGWLLELKKVSVSGVGQEVRSRGGQGLQTTPDWCVGLKHFLHLRRNGKRVRVGKSATGRLAFRKDGRAERE